MAYHIYRCKAVNAANSGSNIIFYTDNDGLYYLQNGYDNQAYSTTNGVVGWSHSCAHSSWPANTRTYTITMDNALRNAITSKQSSGGLINLQNYVSNISELAGKDLNGNNPMQVYGYICKNHSVSGSFDITQYGYWEGAWPCNFPTDIQYSYNIPGVGNVSDTVTILSNGWYTKGGNRRVCWYGSEISNLFSESQLLSPPNNWVNINNTGSIGPFNISSGRVMSYFNTFGYYTINGIYSRNAGTRNIFADNAADVLLNQGNNYFGGINSAVLHQYLNAQDKQTNLGTNQSITNNVILAITDINFQNNTIQVRFAFTHDRSRAFVAFMTQNNRSYVATRISYMFPVTTIHQIQDSWSLTFVPKSDFNPTLANGSGPSTVIWDNSNSAVVLTAGSSVYNNDGFSKIISGHSGSIQCSCYNNGSVVRLTIGGYSITIPSDVRTFSIKVLSVNSSNQLGYWQVGIPSNGMSHSFVINYPATDNAPLVSFENELYTAIVQAFHDTGTPYMFEVTSINDQFSINVTGVVRCDVTSNNGKRYHNLSIYDVNGNFSSLLVKNGTYVTAPITLTADLQVVNNTILVKAGIASIGFTNTSVGAMTISTDAVAVLLPAVASVSKNGARIGYATTTVNQSSFAFSFSAQKDEVEQTDDFVSHYLE